MAESQAEELVKKRKSTSVIWNWFGFSSTDQDQTSAICKVCKEHVKTSDASTTNLFNHLRRRHPKEYAESETMRAAGAATSQAAASVAKPKQTTVTQAGMISPVSGGER